MRYIPIVLLLAGMTAAPALVAAQSTSANKTTTTKSAKTPAEHSVRGVIKSIDASSLILSGSGKKADTTFVLNQTTQREGALAVGSTVSVRYHEDGGSKMATAIVAQPAKEKSSTAAKTTAKK